MNLNKLKRHPAYVVRGWLGGLGLFGKLAPPLLVFGSPNSGTRVLADAIAAHPLITDRSESRLLWDENFHTKNNDTFKTAADVRPKDRTRIRGNFCYYQWADRLPIVMNRHPENSVRIHFMKEIFPEAKLVHIVRNGHAAIYSNYKSALEKESRRIHPFGGYLRPQGWREWLDRPVLDQLSYMWSSACLYASQEGATYGEDFFEVKYEELPEGANTIIPRIWSMLGLDSADEYLEKMPVFENRNSRWREGFTAEELATVERIARPAFDYFGYPCVGPEA